jgi:copper chaperone CopZ
MSVKRMILCLIAAAGVLAVAGCRKQDIRTVTVSVPDMRNRACANIIGNALSQQMGVKPKEMKFDVDLRTVEVSYDSLFVAKKNIEFAIADVGFAANEIPANTNAAARLPAQCRM